MIFRELIAGPPPSINSEKQIDEHSQTVLKVLKNENETIEFFKKSISLFDKQRSKWSNELHRSPDGIKDIKDFTDLLISAIPQNIGFTSDLIEDENFVYKGKIVKIIKDRFGKYCGFIERQPNDIFFHSSSTKGMIFFDAEGKLVSYKVSTSPKNGKLIAVDIDFV